MTQAAAVGEFPDFVQAAKEAVDKFQAKNTPISIHTYRLPKYCKSATFTRSTGGKIFWAVLWREGPVSEAITCDDTLVKDLKELAERGPQEEYEEINGVKWMFETMDQMPSFSRKKKLPRPGVRLPVVQVE